MKGFESSPAEYQRVLEATLGIPFSSGNRVHALRNGIEIFPPMLEAIRIARSSVELLTFIYWRGEIAWQFADALAERARAGLRVRVILDAVGALQMPRELIERMRSAGVDIVWFRPPLRWKIWQADNRTHRKVLVCDGRIAFTGGVGIAEQWEGDARGPDEWRDTHFQVEGPVVHGLRAAFIDNWVEAGRPVFGDIVEAPSLEPAGATLVQTIKTAATMNWSTIATLMHVLLTLSRHKLRITTAYFVPHDALIRQLQEVARRGVDVQILIPGPHHDHPVSQIAQEGEYAALMEAGVRMWAYQPSMLHAKVVTVDNTVACIGSANFNQRSMSKDDELALTVLDEPLLRRLDRDFDDDCKRAVELDPADYRRRGILRKAKTRMVGVFRQQT